MNNQNLKYSLNGNRIKGIIEELCKKINEYYIFPNIAEKVTQYLLNNLEKGSYNGITDPTNLERIISNDMVEASNDLHFYFEYNPSLAEELIQKAQEGKEDSEDDFTEFKSQLKFEQYRNFHIVVAKRLPGVVASCSCRRIFLIIYYSLS